MRTQKPSRDGNGIRRRPRNPVRSSGSKAVWLFTLIVRTRNPIAKCLYRDVLVNVD